MFALILGGAAVLAWTLYGFVMLMITALFHPEESRVLGAALVAVATLILLVGGTISLWMLGLL